MGEIHWDGQANDQFLFRPVGASLFGCLELCYAVMDSFLNLYRHFISQPGVDGVPRTCHIIHHLALGLRLTFVSPHHFLVMELLLFPHRPHLLSLGYQGSRGFLSKGIDTPFDFFKFASVGVVVCNHVLFQGL